ncbi:unnamed protein product, partial [Rotaria sp. Silwood2]
PHKHEIQNETKPQEQPDEYDNLDRHLDDLLAAPHAPADPYALAYDAADYDYPYRARLAAARAALADDYAYAAADDLRFDRDGNFKKK